MEKQKEKEILAKLAIFQRALRYVENAGEDLARQFPHTLQVLKNSREVR